MKTFIVLLVLLFTGLYFIRSGEPPVDYKKAYEAQVEAMARNEKKRLEESSRESSRLLKESFRLQRERDWIKESERKRKEAAASMEASKATREKLNKLSSAVIVSGEEQRLAAQDRAWAESKARAVAVWPQAADPGSEISRVAMQIQEEYISKNATAVLEKDDAPFILYSMAARLLAGRSVPSYSPPPTRQVIVQQVPVYVPSNDTAAQEERDAMTRLHRANVQNSLEQMNLQMRRDAMSERARSEINR